VPVKRARAEAASASALATLARHGLWAVIPAAPVAPRGTLRRGRRPPANRASAPGLRELGPEESVPQPIAEQATLG
jgi:hypothetical protein